MKSLARSPQNSCRGAIVLGIIACFSPLQKEGWAEDCSGGQTVHVSNTSELVNAMLAAQGCETVLLAPGAYADLNLSGGVNRERFNYPNYVTIKSENPSNPAVFENIAVAYAGRIRFDNIIVHHEKKDGEPDYTRAFNVSRTNHFQLVNSELYGSMDGNFLNDVYGFSASQIDTLLLENNTFHDWRLGSIIGPGDRIVVRRNSYFDMSRDGSDFAGVVDVLIEENHYTRSHTNSEHPDMIQFWNNNGVRVMQDVIIRNNVILRGSGDDTQSIFIQSNSAEFRNRNFLIEGNVIYNGHSHGITVYDTDEVTIQHNTVLADTDPQYLARINTFNTSAAVVRNNVATGYSDTGQGTLSEENITAQNTEPNLPTHYDNLFVNANAGPNAKLDDFYPKAESLLIKNPGRDIGALEYDSSPDELTALILLDPRSGAAPLTVHFDGSLSGGPLPIISHAWDFGDGQIASGAVVDHTFTSPGLYVATLTVTDAGHNVDTSHKTIVANPPPITGLVYGLTMDGHAVDFSENKIPTEWVGIEHYDQGISGEGAYFDGTTDGAYLQAPHHPDLDGMSQLTLAFWARKNTAQMGGDVLAKHVSYLARVGEKALTGYVFNQSGDRHDYEVVSDVLNNEDWHHYALTYDGSALTMYLDGEAAASRPMAGPVALHPDRNLIIGKNPWGNAFNGTIDEMRIFNVALSTPEIASLADPTQNHPPFVNAGIDQAIFLPAHAALNGVIRDDGLPNPPGRTTSLWFRLSGPGVVTFEDAQKPITTAAFSAAGKYVLRLMAEDGALNSQDDVTIIVEDPKSDVDVRTETRFIPCMDPKIESHRRNPPVCFQTANPGKVKVAIYTPAGELVRTMVEGEYSTERQTVAWDRKNDNGAVVASGVYVLVLEANGEKKTAKLVVIK